MQHRNLLAAALAAGSLLGAVSLAHAVPAVVANTPYYTGPVVVPVQPVLVQPAPPAPLAEAAPAPRAGYLWNPGHFEWRANQYVWVPGEWMATRSGYGWRVGHWEQRTDGSWQYMAGEWVRSDDLAAWESDRYARRGPLGDRDGDGVLNRDDRYPRDASRF